MCSWFSDSTKTDTQQSTQIPANFQNLMDRTISFANQGLDTPFTAYQGDRISDLSNNEQMGTALAAGNAGMYQDLINMAATNNASMQAKGGLPNADDINGLINPYVNYVLGNSLGRLNEQADTNFTKIGSQAAMSGAFGGSRQGVLEGANLAELLKSTSDLSSSTYSNAYNTGMDNWFKGQGQQSQNIRDAMGIVNQGQQYNTNDINNLMSTGKTGRAVDQAGKDFAYSEFLRQLGDPYAKASFAGSVMAQYPTNLFTRDSSTTQTSTPSILSTAVGLGTAAAGLMTGGAAGVAGIGAGASALGNTAAGVTAQAAANQSSMDSFNNYFNPNPNMAAGGRVRRYKKGGKVKRFGAGGLTSLPQDNGSFLDMMRQKYPGVASLNTGVNAQATPYADPLAQAQAADQKGQWNFGAVHNIDNSAPMAPQQINWDEFFQRHQMKQYARPQPTMGNTFPNASAPYLPSNRPDLSAFVAQMNNRLGNPGSQVTPIDPRLPTPSTYYAGGGRVRRPYSDPMEGYAARTRGPQMGRNYPDPNAYDPLYQDAVNGLRSEFDLDSKVGDLSTLNATIASQNKIAKLQAKARADAIARSGLRQRLSDHILDPNNLPPLPHRQPLPPGEDMGGPLDSSAFTPTVEDYQEFDKRRGYAGGGHVAKSDYQLSAGDEYPFDFQSLSDMINRPEQSTWAAGPASLDSIVPQHYAEPNSDSEYRFNRAHEIASDQLWMQRHFGKGDLSGLTDNTDNVLSQRAFLQAMMRKWGGLKEGDKNSASGKSRKGFAKGGKIQKFAEGGGFVSGGKDFSRYGDLPFDPNQIYSVGPEIPDQQTDTPKKPMNPDLQNFIDRRIDPQEVYTLAAQKWESGADEYGKPNYQSRPWKDSNDHSKGALSSAFGIGQWTHDSWNGMVKKYPKLKLTPMPDTKIKDPETGKMRYKGFDPEAIPSKEEQDKAWGAWQDIAKKELGKANDTPVNRFAWHQLGLEDMKKVQANPNKPISEVLDTLRAHNVSAYDPKKGINKTGAQYFAELQNKIDAAQQWKRDQMGGDGRPADIGDIPNDPLAAATPVQYRRVTIAQSPKTPQSYGDLFGQKGLQKVPDNYVPTPQEAMLANNLITPTVSDRRKIKNGHTLARQTTPNIGDDLLNTASDPLYLNRAAQYMWGGQSFAGGGPVMRDKNGKVIKESKTKDHSWFENIYDNLHSLGSRVADGAANSFGLDGDFGGNSGALPSNKVVSPLDQTMLHPPATPMESGMPQLLTSPYGEDPVDNFWANLDYVGNSGAPYGANTDNLLNALDAGNGGGGLTNTVNDAQAAKQDELSQMLKEYIGTRLQDLKNTDENPETDPLNSVFGNYNKGLFRMGLNILSARTGNAFSNIATGIAATQDQEEAAAMKKIKDKNDRFKDLLNVRYLDAMTNQLSPETRRAIAKENNDTAIAKANITAQAAWARQKDEQQFLAKMAGVKAITGGTAEFLPPVNVNARDFVQSIIPGYPMAVDTSDINETE